MSYIHKVKPWDHQRAVFEMSRDLDEYALFMEQRTGKSKVLIDTCAWQYSHGQINGALIVAPNGVDEDWANNYFSTHWPDWAGEVVIAQWEGKLLKKVEAALYDPARINSFHLLCMNVESFSTSARARVAAEKFLRTFSALMAIDESSLIKDSGAARTKYLCKISPRAVFRRILTGTPSTQSPLDLYSQFKFLNPQLLGFQSYYAFKARYADLLPAGHGLVKHIQEKMPLKLQKRGIVPQVIAKDPISGRPVYKNIEELQALINPHCFRVTRAQCEDMPPKVYGTRNVPMSDEQMHHYKRAVEEIFIETEHGTLTITNQLTRLLRLQQITGGFMPHDEDGGAGVPLKQHRVDALMTEVEQISGGVIVWARFRAELAIIADALREAYGADAVMEYHGGVSEEGRRAAKTAFKLETHAEYPEARFFVGNQAVGSYGLELTVADHVLYYSNLFSLEKRLQSEDRPITMQKPGGIAYLDFVSHGTVDDKVVAALQGKRDVATALLDSGGLTAWLRREEK